MNGHEYSGLKAELVRIAEEMKGLKDILSVRFKPIDKHMEESPEFRDKVVKNSTSIFWLKVITISLIPVCLGWLGIVLRLMLR